MFDIGWMELLIIGVVALIVIGPKDLPEVIRTVGGWMRKARQMAGEFQGHVDQMLKDADLADVKKKFDEVRGFDIKEEITKAIDPKGEMRDALSAPDLDTPSIGASSGAATPSIGAPSAATPAPTAGEPQAPAVASPASASAAPAIAPTGPGGSYWHPELEDAPAFVPPEFVPAKPVAAAPALPASASSPASAADPVPPAFIPPPAEPAAAARS